MNAFPFTLVTEADLSASAARALGTTWMTPALLRAVWAATQPPDIRETEHVVEPWGLVQAEGAMVLFCAQPVRDAAGRRFYVRHCLAVSPADAQALDYRLDPLRPLWPQIKKAVTRGPLPIAPTPGVILPSGAGPLDEAPARVDVLAGLLVAILDANAVPVSLPAVPGDARSFFETLLLVLPRARRRHLSFAVGLDRANPGLEVIVAPRVADGFPAPSGPRVDCWANALRWAFRDGALERWVRLVERVAPDDSATADALWPAISEGLEAIQHPARLYDLLLRGPASPQAVHRLVALQAEMGLLSLEHCPAGFFQDLSRQEDLPAILPHLGTLREQLSPVERTALDGHLLDAARRWLARHGAAGAPFHALATSYRWSARAEGELLGAALPALLRRSAQEAFDALRGYVQRHPGALEHVRADIPEVRALLAYLSEPSGRRDGETLTIGTVRWRVRRWPAPKTVPIRDPPPDSRHAVPYRLRFFDDALRCWVAMRPDLGGVTLAQQGHGIGPPARERGLQDIAATLDAWHRAGAYHGNVSPTHILVDGDAWRLIDEAPDAFALPTPRSQQVADRRALARLLVDWWPGHAPSAVRGHVAAELERLADTGTAGELVTHVSRLTEDEALRRAVSATLGDPHIAREIHATARDVLEGYERRLRALEQRVEDLSRDRQQRQPYDMAWPSEEAAQSRSRRATGGAQRAAPRPTPLPWDAPRTRPWPPIALWLLAVAAIIVVVVAAWRLGPWGASDRERTPTSPPAAITRSSVTPGATPGQTPLPPPLGGLGPAISNEPAPARGPFGAVPTRPTPSPEPPATPPSVHGPAQERFVVCVEEGLSIRDSAGTGPDGGMVLGTAERGEALQVLEAEEIDGTPWLQIVWQDKTAWVSGDEALGIRLPAHVLEDPWILEQTLGQCPH